MSAFPQSLLKLGPGNPILLRVVTAGGRRIRHALARWTYLGLLIGVLMVALFTSTSATGAMTLSDLAKASTQVFKYISYVQLAMICLLAPVFTAGAITQERDSRTYNILLSTPLTNAQILFGSLFSRLYYVVALLLSGVPVFAITLFYGGVTGWNIAMSFAIAMSTALFTGALAIAIAVFRLGSGKTVFWFYVFNAVYLVGLWFIDSALSVDPGNASLRHTTLLTGIHPFLALQSVVNPTEYVTPDLSSLANMSGWLRWYLAFPAYAYVALTTTASLLLIVPSALVLRRVSQRSDASLWTYLRSLLPGGGARTRKARHVWSNPVAWREAATRAAASGRGITRYLTIVVGLAAALSLLWAHQTGRLDTDWSRRALIMLVVVEFSVSLLVASNTSASAVTRERESQTLDLLLVTPITSRYYIWGKLRGLVSFMLPFAAVPTATIVLVVLYDLLRGSLWSDPLVWPEAILEMPLYLTAVLAWACMLGLNLSLKFSRTIVAVIATVFVIAGVCGVLGVCGFATTRATSWFGLMVGAFSPFTAILILLNPTEFAAGAFGSAGVFAPGSDSPPWMGRAIFLLALLAASLTYCGLTWTMYRSMVRNFDMIIRRQHQ